MEFESNSHEKFKGQICFITARTLLSGGPWPGSPSWFSPGEAVPPCSPPPLESGQHKARRQDGAAFAS